MSKKRSRKVIIHLLEHSYKKMKLDRECVVSAELKEARKNKKINCPDIKLNSSATTISSSLMGSALISRVHALLKYISQVKADRSLSEDDRNRRVVELEKEIEEVGGLEAYHAASYKGETNTHTDSFNSSKWVMNILNKERGRVAGRKISLLDVGALVNHYVQFKSYIDSRAINLTPVHESVEEGDILLHECETGYDVIVLSLVVNFEGDPHRRGEMLKICSQLLKKKMEGLGFLFLSLPRACIDNSRYMKHGLLISMMESLSFSLHHHTTSQLLSMYTFILNKQDIIHNTDGLDKKGGNETVPLSFRRQLCRGGKERNNFCIILD